MEKEQVEKEKRIQEFMVRNKLDALLLSQRNNFAWVTGGADNHVVLGSELGVASILIVTDGTKLRKYIITDNIEVMRIKSEELKGQNFTYESYFWYENKDKIFSRLTSGLQKIASDDGYPGTKIVSITDLQRPLLPEEVKRYKWLGEKSADCMNRVCQQIKPGYTEHQVAGMVSRELFSEGIIPVVILIAADERIFEYRHPIPTDKKIKKYVMVVFCAQKYGLIVSMTRLVHFGKISSELKKKHDAVTKVDACFILNSVPGETVGEIFKKAVRMYAKVGFPDEWKLHHQGGPTGYMTREYKATEKSNETLTANRALAWNPSITGTKSEDTIITQDNQKPMIITEIKSWPMLKVSLDEGEILRPDILVK